MNDQPFAVDRPAIRRRRRLLFGFAALVSTCVIAFAVIQLLSGNTQGKPTPITEAKPPTILERVVLTAANGRSGHGIAELVRRSGGEGLRVLAVKLHPSSQDEIYQLLLAGGRRTPKLLGNEVVGDSRTFVGEASLDAAEIHRYRGIELRRVTKSDPPVSKLVLHGSIPR